MTTESDPKPTTPEERREVRDRINSILVSAQAHEDSKDKEAEMFLRLQEEAKTFDREKFNANYGAEHKGSEELTKSLAKLLKKRGVDVRHLYSPVTIVVHGGEQKVAYTARSYETDRYEISDDHVEKGLESAADKIDKVMALSQHETIFLLGMFPQKAMHPESFALGVSYKVRFFTTPSLDEKI